MSWTQPGFADVAELVNRRAGLSFANRQEGAEQSICRAMTRARSGDLAHYIEHIARDEAALDDLITELTVGETYFFREPAQFRLIETEILPEIQQRRGDQHPPRVWSAGCATGEEAYSLAILLERAGLPEPTRVLATDIARSALAKTRQALYGAWSLRTASAQSALPYLTPVGKNFRLDDNIRRRVSVSYLNLALDSYPSLATGFWDIDLILCRNVLIYLDRATIANVAQRLYRTLAEGGWLITASSDPPLWDEAPFAVVHRADCLVYRRLGNEIPQTPTMVWPRADAGFAAIAPLDPPAVPAVEAAQLLEPVDRLADARGALACGDYARAAALSAAWPEDADAAVLHVRALANVDPAAAAEACVLHLARHAFCAELHYLRAIALLDLQRDAEAIEALRRVIYLDRTLAVAHFTLGAILRQGGDRAGAARAFRNARDLCAGRPADETLPLADDENAGRLAEVAAAELALLEDS